MPYIDNSELPLNVRKSLPTDAQTLFRLKFNNIYDFYTDTYVTKSDREEIAFDEAWKAVEKEYTLDDSGEWVNKKSDPKPLYVYRKVLNAKEIIDWAKSVGFETVVEPDDLHVTVIYSRQPVDWFDMQTDWVGDAETGELVVKPGGPRLVSQFNEATVLQFSSQFLSWRHEDMRRNGAHHDYEYSPHITLTYNKPDDLDISQIAPYIGQIKLGPEIFQEINEDYRSTLIEKFTIIKSLEEQQMIYGWASVVSKNNVPVEDHQGDVILASEMELFTTEFMMKQNRKSLAMHGGDQIGEVVHSFPLTNEIAKSLGIECQQEGWIVGVKIHDDAIWNKAKSGELPAFSIGARGVRQEYVGVSSNA